MGAKLIPVLLQPLLRVELRRPPGALELIELTLGFREATPELVYVAFQAVALLVQLTEALMLVREVCYMVPKVPRRGVTGLGSGR